MSVPDIPLASAPGSAAPHEPAQRRRASGPFGLLHSRVLGWSALALLVLAWEVIGRIAPSPGLPPPSRIGDALADEIQHGELVVQLLDTLTSMAYGFSIAIVLGIVIGVAMARSKTMFALLEPFVELWRPVPSVVFIPVIILYAGLGRPMNVIVIVLTATEAIVLNALSGARSISPTLLRTATTFRLTWWQTLREIVVPAAAPQIFVGLRLALAKSLVIAVGAGMIAGDSGIGFYIVNAQQTLDIPRMYAGAITVALVGYLLNAVFVACERKLLHWHAGHDENRTA